MLRRSAISLPFVLIGLAACQPQPTPTGAVISDTVTVVATIESVNPQTREVVLIGQDGHRLFLRLGPEVQNFAQLRAGQRVQATYHQAFAAQIAPAGSSAPPELALAAGRAAPGELPAAAVAGGVRVRVTITAVYLATNTVAFVGPRGIERSVYVRDPAMQALLRTLQPGSQVDLTYVEAVTVNVTPIAG
jgi:hypothetical protein